MKVFEEKCRCLYEARLSAYVESADRRLSECEERLLVSGAHAAQESSSLEVKIDRLRLACGKWRADYQREVQRRYYTAAKELEARYMSEIGSLLADLTDASCEISLSHTGIRCSKTDGTACASIIDTSNSLKLNDMRAQLVLLWDQLQTPYTDRLAVLCAIFTTTTPELSGKYSRTANALSAQIPIFLLIKRLEFIKHRLLILSRLESTHLKISLKTEVCGLCSEVQHQLSIYEAVHKQLFIYRGQPYSRPSCLVTQH